MDTGCWVWTESSPQVTRFLWQLHTNQQLPPPLELSAQIAPNNTCHRIEGKPRCGAIGVRCCTELYGAVRSRISEIAEQRDLISHALLRTIISCPCCCICMAPRSSNVSSDAHIKRITGPRLISLCVHALRRKKKKEAGLAAQGQAGGPWMMGLINSFHILVGGLGLKESD